MPNAVDISNTTVVLNGHTFSGWSDDTDALLMPDIVQANVKRGGDGKMSSHSTGDKGGPVTIKLLATSDSARFLMNAATTQRNGGAIEWNGLVRDNGTGLNTTLQRGVMTVAPGGQTVGKGDAANREFTFEFETVDTDASATNFLGGALGA